MQYTNLLDITCVQIQKGSPIFHLLKIKSNSYSVSSNHNHLVSLPFSAAIFPNSTLPKRKCCNLRLSSRWHRVLSALWLPDPHRKKKNKELLTLSAWDAKQLPSELANRISPLQRSPWTSSNANKY